MRENTTVNFRDLVDEIDWEKLKPGYHEDDELLKELCDLITFNILPDNEQQQYAQLVQNDPSLRPTDFFKAARHFGAVKDDPQAVSDKFHYGLLNDDEREKCDEFLSGAQGANVEDYYKVLQKSIDMQKNPNRAKLARLFEEIKKLL